MNALSSTALPVNSDSKPSLDSYLRSLKGDVPDLPFCMFRKQVEPGSALRRVSHGSVEVLWTPLESSLNRTGSKDRTSIVSQPIITTYCLSFSSTDPHPALCIPSERGMPLTVFIKHVNSSSTRSCVAPSLRSQSTISVSGAASAVYGSHVRCTWIRYSSSEGCGSPSDEVSRIGLCSSTVASQAAPAYEQTQEARHKCAPYLEYSMRTAGPGPLVPIRLCSEVSCQNGAQRRGTHVDCCEELGFGSTTWAASAESCVRNLAISMQWTAVISSLLSFALTVREDFVQTVTYTKLVPGSLIPHCAAALQYRRQATRTKEGRMQCGSAHCTIGYATFGR